MAAERVREIAVVVRVVLRVVAMAAERVREIAVVVRAVLRVGAMVLPVARVTVIAVELRATVRAERRNMKQECTACHQQSNRTCPPQQCSFRQKEMARTSQQTRKIASLACHYPRRRMHMAGHGSMPGRLQWRMWHRPQHSRLHRHHRRHSYSPRTDYRGLSRRHRQIARRTCRHSCPLHSSSYYLHQCTR